LRVVGSTDHEAVRAENGARFENIECDTGRFLVGDIDNDHIGEFFFGDAARNRCANIPCAAHDRHFSIHLRSSKTENADDRRWMIDDRRSLGHSPSAQKKIYTGSVENPVEKIALNTCCSDELEQISKLHHRGAIHSGVNRSA
jgi:hypothetical protein